MSVAISSNMGTKPSQIQSNVIISDLRNRKSWDQVGKTIKKVSSTKLISNDKVRQKKTLQPDGEGFSAVKELKTYTDQKDIFLIYDITRMSNMYLKPLFPR